MIIRLLILSFFNFRLQKGFFGIVYIFFFFYWGVWCLLVWKILFGFLKVGFRFQGWNVGVCWWQLFFWELGFKERLGYGRLVFSLDFQCFFGGGQVLVCFGVYGVGGCGVGVGFVVSWSRVVFVVLMVGVLCDWQEKVSSWGGCFQDFQGEQFMDVFSNIELWEFFQLLLFFVLSWFICLYYGIVFWCFCLGMGWVQ